VDSALLKLKKKKGLMAGIVCGFFLALVLGGTLFLESRFSQRIFLNLLHEAIPGHLSFEKMELSLFAGKLDLTGLVLQGPEKQEIIQVEKVSLNLSWTRLLSGEIFLSSIFLDSPEFDFSILEDGSFNLLSAFIPPDSAPPEKRDDSQGFFLNVLVKKFVLNSGTIQVNIPDKDLDLLVSDMDILIFDVNLFDESAGLRLDFKRGKINDHERSIVLEPCRIEADLMDGGLVAVGLQWR